MPAFRFPDETVLSNPTYQFFLIAILAFSGVGVFMAVSVAIIYLVKKIRDDASGRRRSFIEMDDKGRFYYQSCDSSYSVGSGYTSHSQISSDDGAGVTSPEGYRGYAFRSNVTSGFHSHAGAGFPVASRATAVQPVAGNDQGPEYGTFYGSNYQYPSAREDRQRRSRIDDEYNWRETSQSDDQELLSAAREKKRSTH